MRPNVFLSWCGFALLVGCSSASKSSLGGQTSDAGWGAPDTGVVPPGPLRNPDAGPCQGLQCQQMSCASGTTSVSGTVYDPAGRNPLYNVVVYVPNSELDPMPQGASCETCNSLFSGHPIATTLTDAAGKFTLPNAPVGDNIPLVVQVGKWRRKIVIPHVTGCQDNPQPDQSVRLPRNHQEGDLPNIAISTGAADTLECLLRRIGVDASEYVPGASNAGRIHIFTGGGGGGGGALCFPVVGCLDSAPTTQPPAPSSSQALWSSAAELEKYDIVLLSCEGDETQQMNQQALHDYASNGGRVFASHFHYSWFNTGPYASENIATWHTGANSINNVNANIVTTLPDGKPFPKGQALHDWLGNVRALNNGELPIQDARHNADVAASNVSQTWIVADQQAQDPGAVQYLSFNTPTMVAPDHTYCGRVVYSDLHVGAASGDNAFQPVPASCASGELSPQEKALEFMLFDLSSCVTPDTAPPPIPIVL